MIEREPKISFIIPVYNVEDYLEKCFNSILNQSSGDWEIIVINDGSTDDSLKICLDYQEHYQNVTVISQANCGQGSARNSGLNISRGKYVSFVDPDDWVESGMVEELLPILEKSSCDFLNFGIDFIDDHGKLHKTLNKFEYEEIKGINIFKDALIDRNIYSSPCNKIYRKSFLIENDIYFPCIRQYEDVYYSRLVSSKSCHCLFVSKVYYHALIRANSTTRAMGIENIKSAHLVIRMERDNLFPNIFLPSDLKDIFQSHCLKFISGLIIQAAYRINNMKDYINFCKIANINYYFINANNFKLIRYLKLKNYLMVKIINYPIFVRYIAKLFDYFSIRPY